MTTALHSTRFAAVRDVVRVAGARAVLDLGYGDGAFLLPLAAEPWIERVLGVDLDAAALASLERGVATQPPAVRRKVELRSASYLAPDPGAPGLRCRGHGRDDRACRPGAPVAGRARGLRHARPAARRRHHAQCGFQ
jgi:hypothetical protein